MFVSEMHRVSSEDESSRPRFGFVRRRQEASLHDTRQSHFFGPKTQKEENRPNTRGWQTQTETTYLVASTGQTRGRYEEDRSAD